MTPDALHTRAQCLAARGAEAFAATMTVLARQSFVVVGDMPVPCGGRAMTTIAGTKLTSPFSMQQNTLPCR